MVHSGIFTDLSKVVVLVLFGFCLVLQCQDTERFRIIKTYSLLIAFLLVLLCLAL